MRAGYARVVRFSLVLCVASLVGGLGAVPPSTVAVNEPPKLLSFEARQSDYGVYSVYGEVSDEYPEGCFVQFGGALEGYYAVVMDDGSYRALVETGYGGKASAEAVDDVGQTSNILWTSIQ